MANTARHPQTGRFIPKTNKGSTRGQKATTRHIPSKASTKKG